MSIALKGKGAFGRFHEVLDRHDLRDEWFAFKNETYRQKAIKWCKENKIPFIS